MSIKELIFIVSFTYLLYGVLCLILEAVASYQAGQRKIEEMNKRHEAEREEFAAWKKSVQDYIEANK